MPYLVFFTLIALISPSVALQTTEAFDAPSGQNVAGGLSMGGIVDAKDSMHYSLIGGESGAQISGGEFTERPVVGIQTIFDPPGDSLWVLR
ncbi:MAG: hypothetical protein ACFCU1_11755 [Sumerlaeia bacterium]